MYDSYIFAMMLLPMTATIPKTTMTNTISTSVKAFFLIFMEMSYIVVHSCLYWLKML